MGSAYSLPSGGFSLEGGQYLLNSYWKACVSAVDWNQKVADSRGRIDGAVFDHVHWTLAGGWMYRIAGAYSRKVSLYCGGCAFLGYNSYELFKSLPEEMDAGYPSGEFIYGIRPEVDLEWFVFRKAAVVLGVQSPVTFGSSLKTDIWHLTASLGIRFNL